MDEEKKQLNTEEIFTSEDDTKTFDTTDNNEKDSDQTLNDEVTELYSEEDQTSDQETVSDDEERKEKIKKIAIITGVSALALLVIAYIWGGIFYSSHFFPKVVINGINVGNKTTQQALAEIDKDYEERSVAIVGENNQTNTVTGAQINLLFDSNIGDLNDLIKEQNSWAWIFKIFSRDDVDLSTDYTYNQQLLDQVVTSLPLVSGPDIVTPKDAYITYNGSDFEIVPAVEGDAPNVSALEKAVLDALLYKDKIVNLQTGDLYLKPTVTQNDSTLQSNLNTLNKALNASITLTFPNQNVVIDKGTFVSWLNLTNNVVSVNSTALANYVAGLANQFNTVNKDISFTTTTGGTLNFKLTSGWELNQSAEISTLNQQILSGTVITEEPEWTQKGNNFIVGSTISTYLEVSLNSQMIWYYKNGALNSSSGIVSGDVQTNQTTPTGLYFILSKNTQVSQSVRYPDGSMNTTTVNYWFPFTNRYGIASATWRDNFGGDIYKTQGTTGNIDVPNSFAQSLYNVVEDQTPIFIYN